MPFIWTSSPQIPTPTLPQAIPSNATSYKVHVVANTVNAGGTLLYNTQASAYEVIYEYPTLNVGALVARNFNASTSNITSLNLISGTIQTNADEGMEIVNFTSRGGGGGTANIVNVSPILYDSTTGVLRLANSGVTASGYGSTNTIPTFVVDSLGRITNAANIGITVELQSHPSILINEEQAPTSIAAAGDPILSGYRYGNSWVPRQSVLPNDLGVTQWGAIAFNGTIFVATSFGSTGVSYTVVSDDGVNWRDIVTHSATSAGLPSGTVVWDGVLWVPSLGKFLIAGRISYPGPSDRSLFALSSDGITWNYTYNSLQEGYLGVGISGTLLVYGDGKIIGVANTGTLKVSVDALTWSSATINSAPVTYESLAYGDTINRFVSIGRTALGAKVFHISLDGYNWLYGSSNSSSGIGFMTYASCIYGGGVFVAGGTVSGAMFANAPNIIVSTTGTEWEFRTPQVTSIYELSYGNGRFVGFNGTSNAYVSSDGIGLLWTPTAIPSVIAPIGAAAFGRDKFVTVGAPLSNPNLTAFSYGTSDASQWIGSLGKTNGRVSLAYGAGSFVMVGGAAILTSTDGISWGFANGATIGDWNSVAWSGSIFAAIGRTGAVQTSPTGSTWTPQATVAGLYNDITWNGNVFVAVGTSGSVKTSPDGVSWTVRTAPSNNWNGVISSNALTVAVGNSNAAMSSPDGITWTQRIGANGNWNAVAWNGSLFAAVGSSVMTSYDGITWTPRSNIPTGTWTNICWNGSVFAAIGTNILMTSPDGITWTQRTNIPPSSWIDIASGNGLFAAVGNSSNNLIMSTEPMEVTSVVGRTGTILLDTFDITENAGGPFYHTSVRVRGNVSNTTPINYDIGSGTFSHANSGVSIGTYGNASHVPVTTVDIKGHVTSVINTQIALSASQITSGILSVARGGTGKDSTGLVNGALLIGNTVNSGFDLIAIAQTFPIIVTSGQGTIRLSHASSGVVAGIYGNATLVPAITVDGNGHITSVTNTSIATLPAATANGQLLIGNTVSGGFDVRTLTPGTGIVISNGAGTITISTPSLMPTGNGINQVFYENDQNVTGNYTITTGKSAMSAGPITLNPGVIVTVPPGSRWVVV